MTRSGSSMDNQERHTVLFWSQHPVPDLSFGNLDSALLLR